MAGNVVYQAQSYSNGVMGCSLAFSNSNQEFTNPLEGSHDVTSSPCEGTSPSLVFAKRISGAALSAAFSLAGYRIQPTQHERHDVSHAAVRRFVLDDKGEWSALPSIFLKVKVRARRTVHVVGTVRNDELWDD